MNILAEAHSASAELLKRLSLEAAGKLGADEDSGEEATRPLRKRI